MISIWVVGDDYFLETKTINHLKTQYGLIVAVDKSNKV